MGLEGLVRPGLPALLLLLEVLPVPGDLCLPADLEGLEPQSHLLRLEVLVVLSNPEGRCLPAVPEDPANLEHRHRLEDLEGQHRPEGLENQSLPGLLEVPADLHPLALLEDR